MQIYKSKVFYVIGVFLDTRFIESVVIQMTDILYEIIYIGLGFIMILLLWWIYMKHKCLWHGKMNAFNLYAMQYMILELWII